MYDSDKTFVYIAIFVLWGFFSAIVGSCEAGKSIRKDAVKNNVAQWVADESGSVKFQWKVLTEKENK
jgi:DNA-directed RNA polymerase specialized sigma54-like protein